MPRYFVDLTVDADHRIDCKGQRFSSEDEAITSMLTSLQTIIRKQGRPHRSRSYHMSIRDKTGFVVFETCITARAEVVH